MTLLFPGTFNPFTTGHYDLVERALGMAGRVHIVVGYNMAKGPDAEAEQRAESIRSIFHDRPEVEVHLWGGLTVDIARRLGADAILRGVRSVADFEYERNLADINMKIAGIDTVLLFARPELACVSSSMVRELKAHGHDISKYIPHI